MTLRTYTRLLAALAGLTTLLEPHHASAAGSTIVVAADRTPRAGGVVHKGKGIRLTATLRGKNVVVIRWHASRTVRRVADEYAFQYWRDGWHSFLYTHQGTHGRIPVAARLPGSDGRFCLRMIGFQGGNEEDGRIVGSGTSGNEPPCR